MLCVQVADRGLFQTMQDPAGTGYLSDTFLKGDPKIQAADVNGTLYLCYRHWTISVFPGRTSTDSQYHSAGKVPISVSMCKIQY